MTLLRWATGNSMKVRKLAATARRSSCTTTGAAIIDTSSSE